MTLSNASPILQKQSNFKLAASSKQEGVENYLWVF